MATNFVASQPPKRRPTGMPTACANEAKSAQLELELGLSLATFTLSTINFLPFPYFLAFKSCTPIIHWRRQTSGHGIVHYGEEDEDDVDDGEGDEEAVEQVVGLEFSQHQDRGDVSKNTKESNY